MVSGAKDSTPLEEFRRVTAATMRVGFDGIDEADALEDAEEHEVVVPHHLASVLQ